MILRVSKQYQLLCLSWCKAFTEPVCRPCPFESRYNLQSFGSNVLCIGGNKMLQLIGGISWVQIPSFFCSCSFIFLIFTFSKKVDLYIIQGSPPFFRRIKDWKMRNMRGTQNERIHFCISLLLDISSIMWKIKNKKIKASISQMRNSTFLLM